MSENVTDIPTAYERMATAPCRAWAWIGQPFTSCDECGKPFWEHSHEWIPLNGPFSTRWRRAVISTNVARIVRARWAWR